MLRDFFPISDPSIPCEVRLWQHETVVVFVHPRDWKTVSIVGGVSMIIVSCGTTFPCKIFSGGEYFKIGLPKQIHPEQFDVYGHGDYPGIARVDWPTAIPDLLKQKLLESDQLLESWRTLTHVEMRTQLSFINRARNTNSITERQLVVVSKLSEYVL